MNFTVREVVEVAPESAFDAMADARNETSWNSQVSRSELVSGEPIGLGSRFLTVNRGKEYVATISRYERPGDLAFDVSGKPMDITASFAFRPQGDATELTGTFDMRPKGAMKLAFRLLTPVIRRDLRKQARSFKAFCESR